MFEKETTEHAEKILESLHVMNGREWAIHDVTFKDGAELGYSKGLEEGRTKWHDLLKNPEDLPGKGKVAFYHVVMTNEGFREYCNTFTGEWFAAGTFELVDKPRAWCELPKFEEVTDENKESVW